MMHVSYIIIAIFFCACNSTSNQKIDPVTSNNKSDTISDQAELVAKKLNDSIIRKKIQSEFEKHFHILDSASKATRGNEIECAYESAEFMEVQTRIESTGISGYLGILSFMKSDLRKWHQWYEKHKDSIFVIKPVHY